MAALNLTVSASLHGGANKSLVRAQLLSAGVGDPIVLNIIHGLGASLHSPPVLTLRSIVALGQVPCVRSWDATTCLVDVASGGANMAIYLDVLCEVDHTIGR